MLTTYRLDNPETDEVLVLDRRSYVWAALGGPLYLVAKRLYLLAVVMLVVMAAVAAAAIVGLTVSVYLFDASLTGLITMAVIVAAAFALNGIIAIRLVCYGYRRKGWEEQRA